MQRVLAFSAFFAAARGLVLTTNSNLRKLSPDVALSEDKLAIDDALFEKAEASVGIEKPYDKDAKDCGDMSGNYEDKRGLAVEVHQVGCSVKIKLREGWKSGEIASNAVKVADFNAPGHLDVSGDIFFTDGGHWKKTAGKKSGEQVTSVNFKDAQSASTSTSVEDAAHTDAAQSPQDAMSITPGQSAQDKVTACSDVSGDYQNKAGKPLKIAQTGCDLKVTLSFNPKGDTVKSGQIAGDQLSVAGMDHAGTFADGAVKFGDGGLWQKAGVKAAMAGDTQDSAALKECTNIRGEYDDGKGHPLTVYQVGCFVKVKMFWDQQTGYKIVSGAIEADSLSVQDFSMPGKIMNTGDVSFSDGGNWKLRARKGASGLTAGEDSETGALTAVNDKCADVGGHYMNAAGNPVSVTQSGCTLVVEMYWDEKAGNVIKTGGVDGIEVAVTGFTATGAVNGDNVDFSDGGHWKKISSTEVASEVATEVASDPTDGCTDFTGEYVDEQGKPVMISQTDCHLEVTFFLDSSNGNITKTGDVSESTMHIQDFIQDGLSSDEGVKFGNIATWRKVVSPVLSSDIDISSVAETAVEQNIPVVAEAEASADESTQGQCESFGGLYKDKGGKLVIVNQTGCAAEITFWLDSINGNVTKMGSIAGETMHIQDFVADGQKSESGIKFGDIAEWVLTNPGVDFRNDVAAKELMPAGLNDTAVLDDQSDETMVFSDASTIAQPDPEAIQSLTALDTPANGLVLPQNGGNPMNPPSAKSIPHAAAPPSKVAPPTKSAPPPAKAPVKTAPLKIAPPPAKTAPVAPAKRVPAKAPVPPVKAAPSPKVAPASPSMKLAPAPANAAHSGALAKKSSDEQCDDISGDYKDMNGWMVKIGQTNCDLEVEVYWNKTLGRVMKYGQVVTSQDAQHITVEDFKTEGFMRKTGFDIEFTDGGRWNKVMTDVSSKEACLAPARLMFLHVMKNGGTSVDQYVSCHCNKVGCSVTLSLGPVHLFEGRKSCNVPSVCSTHGDFRDRATLCGSGFQEVDRVFTVFRDPVDRVFSLYNYEKTKGLKLPPLATLYSMCDQHEGEAESNATWICAQIVNHLVVKTFNPNEMRYTSKLNNELLNIAKDATKNLDAIFFMDDFATFPQAFQASGLLPPINDNQKKCGLEHANPTKCPNCADEPTADEINLIRNHNNMDTALFEWAKGLGNRYTGASAASLLQSSR